MIQKNQIIKSYGTQYKKMTKELLEQTCLEELLERRARERGLPGKECRIMIKPNLVSPTPACCGATTHPEIVAGILEYLQERGYGRIMIAEGSWVGDKTEDAVEVCGYGRLTKQYGVPFCDTQKEPSFEKDCGGMKLNLCRCIRETDFLINVPVLKGHCQTKITCALKNMKGLLPDREKRRFHTLGLHRPIAHLALGIRQDFIVVDHICGDLDFEDGGNPVVKNCIMAARDPVLVDAYVCRLLGYTTDQVPYVAMAAGLGAGSGDLSDAEILTCDGKRDEEGLTRERKVVEVQDQVAEVDSCSACYGCLIPALDRLKEEGLLERLDTKICIGQGYQGKTGKLGIGQCTRCFDYSVKGCPPSEEEIYQGLKGYLKSAAAEGKDV